METRAPFTLENAYTLQADDITRWSKVLNVDSYIKLLQEALRRNALGYQSPYDVFRGNDITTFICNLER